MRKIGIVGGLGPESTLYYYRMLIDLSRENQAFAGNMPEIIIYSVSMGQTNSETSSPQNSKTRVAKKISSVIQSLHKAGADFVIIACNTAHRNIDYFRAASPIPILSIVEETCRAVDKLGFKRVGLLGNAITASEDFYPDVFSRRNITLVVPNEDEQDYIHSRLFGEAANSIGSAEVQNQFQKIARRMKSEEAIEGLVLGCTEIPLIMSKANEKELGIPFFDTSRIHVQSALKYCLSGNGLESTA